MPNTSLPNVLFIVVDQWRGEALGRLGAVHAHTPNLDRLAARGVTFSRHFAQGAPCGPARASLLTGQYVMNHRVVTNGVPLDRRHAHLAREIRRAGRDPALIGYTTTTPDPYAVGFEDIAFTRMGEAGEGWTLVGDFAEEEHLDYLAWARRRDPEREIASVRDLWAPNDSSGRPTDAPTRGSAETSDSRWSSEHALDYLALRTAQPWFLHLGFLRPHPPFSAPHPYNEIVDPADLPRARRAAAAAEECGNHPALAFFHSILPMSSFLLGGEGNVAAMTEAEITGLRRSYYGLIAEVDAEIGRVLDFLDRTSQTERTLIVFTSDHGEQLGDHHLLGKCCFYDESYHIPLIIADPRPEAEATRGSVVRGLTESVDVMPTILDWLKLPVPISCDGHSLLPLLRGEAGAAARDAVHFEFSLRIGYPYARVLPPGLDWRDAELAVLRTDKYKYVHFPTLPPVLFDLEADPGEFHNRADDPAYAGIALEMAQRMLTWRMRHAERTLSRYTTSRRGLVDWAVGQAAR
ncbi:MAG: alkaline phosphatase family protein [Aliidongia sp.]